MNQTVYLLSSLTALVCSILLLRGYWQRRIPLLLWCGLFFCALTVENAMLFVDLMLNFDLAWPRRITALVGTSLLVVGLVQSR